MKSRIVSIAAAVSLSTVLAIVAADTYTGAISVSPQITHQSTTAGSSLMESLQSVYSYTISSATNNAAYLNALYVASGSLAAGATNSVDLYGSVLNSFGATLNMAKVKGLILCPSNTVQTTVTLRPAAANGMTNLFEDASGITVRTAGCFALFAKDTAGYTVANGSMDAIEIVNNGTNTTTYSLYVFGE